MYFLEFKKGALLCALLYLQEADLFLTGKGKYIAVAVKGTKRAGKQSPPLLVRAHTEPSETTEKVTKSSNNAVDMV